MECSRCGEEVARDEDGGWQCTEDRQDVYAHYGLCPAEKAELWARLYLARWNAKMDEVEAAIPELPGIVYAAPPTDESLCAGIQSPGGSGEPSLSSP